MALVNKKVLDENELDHINFFAKYSMVLTNTSPCISNTNNGGSPIRSAKIDSSKLNFIMNVQLRKIRR